MQRIESWKGKTDFLHAFHLASGCDIPAGYVHNQNVWGVFTDFGWAGGFALVDVPVPRTLEEIPEQNARDELEGRVCEITAYFCTDKRHITAIKRRMAIEVAKSRKMKFIYAYNISSTGLGRYYAMGRPKVLYRGVTSRGGEPQSIEMLTKAGVMSIIAKSTAMKIKERLFR
jgi:hypothetical protein